MSRPLTDAEREVCRLCGDSWPRTTEYWHRHPETADRLDTRCIPCSTRVKNDSRHEKRNKQTVDWMLR